MGRYVLAAAVGFLIVCPAWGQCTDADGDGFYYEDGCGTALDCNDANPTTYPGAPEVCDLEDHDCDGVLKNDTPCGPLVTDTVPVAGRPYAVAVTPDGAQVLVTRIAADEVAIIDTETSTLIDSLAVGVSPVSLAVTRDGSTALVANNADGTVSVVDLVAGTVVDTVTTGGEPWDVAITLDGTTAVVAIGSSGVALLDLASRTVLDTIAVGTYAWGIAVTPDNSTALVSDIDDNVVRFLDLTSRAVVATVPVGERPARVAIASDGALAFVANFVGASVSLIRVVEATVVDTIAIDGVDVWDVAVAADNTTAMVISQDPTGLVGQVTSINVQPLAIINKVNTGNKPRGIAPTPVGKVAWVAFENSDEVSAIAECTDADGDALFDEEACGTVSDCDDSVATCTIDCTTDVDADGAIDCADECIDADGDDYGTAGGAGDTCAGPDCDDTNPEINPASTEIVCDGVDNDCNPTTVDLIDGDSDGFLCDMDCNDANPTIHPGASEVCDGYDNDCDGYVDNAADCDGVCDDPDVMAEPATFRGVWTGDSYAGYSNDYIYHYSPSGELVGNPVYVGDVAGDLIWMGSGYAFISGCDGPRIALSAFNATGVQLADNVVLVDGRVPPSNARDHCAVVWTGSRIGLAWEDELSGTRELYFAQYDSVGVRVSATVQLSGASAEAGWPAIAWTGQEYGVAWVAGTALLFTRVSVQGVEVGQEAILGGDVSPESTQLALVWTGEEYGLLWAQGILGSFRVKLSRVAANGVSLSETDVDGVDWAGVFVSLVWTGEEFGVQWSPYHGGTRFRRIDSTGNALDLPLLLSGCFRPFDGPFWTGYEYGTWNGCGLYLRIPCNCLDGDGDGITECNDCDDANPHCESDCTDGDSDGFCVTTDCNDALSAVHPGAPEICDGLDSDCDSVIPADETDDDGDGLSECVGDCNDANPNCAADCTDLDADGYCIDHDCADDNAAVYPNAVQVCGDAANNDCGHPEWPALQYTNEADDDGDGVNECMGDCDDALSAVHPGAPDTCDGLNNDCDTPQWPSLVGTNDADDDGDGLSECDGDCDDASHNCISDCTDNDNDNYCIDFDCDDSNQHCTSDCTDGDTDGFCVTTDCDDSDSAVFPGAPEICDGVDSDCDGSGDLDPTRLGSDRHIASTIDRFPAMAWTGSSYGVVWFADGFLRFAALDPFGTLPGDSHEVVAVPTDSRDLSVVWNGNGFAVAWLEESSWVKLARLTTDGTVIDGPQGTNPLTVNSAPATSWGEQLADMTWNGSEYGLAWGAPVSECGENVFFARVDSAGTKLSEVDLLPCQSGRWLDGVAVTWNGNGYGVAWVRSYDYESVVVLNADGTPAGPVQVNVFVSSYMRHRVSLVWNGTEYGVVGVGSSMSRPSFSRLDSDGNNISTAFLGTSSEGLLTVPHPVSLLWNGAEWGVTYGLTQPGDGDVGPYFVRVGVGGQQIEAAVPISPEAVGTAGSLGWNGTDYAVAWPDRRNGELDLFFATIAHLGCHCVDSDMDGFDRCDDCNDTEPAVYPGAIELCDNASNDCDNPGWPTVPYDEADSDGDSYRICEGDCDDADSAVNPSATETCNSIDDNCNTLVDEDDLGEDTDSDGVHNLCDNCREDVNSSQLDVDNDDVGNSCDNCVLTVNPDQSDLDLDDRGDLCDNCPTEANYFQDDYDGDSFGDACDNCFFDHNPTQTDMDSDYEGDICDLDDGVIYIRFHQPEYVEWQEEVGYTQWNCYRGDLALLRSSGIYTQDPATVDLAAKYCGENDPWALDTDPEAGGAVFFLTTGLSPESSLGVDSEGVERVNTNPCP